MLSYTFTGKGQDSILIKEKNLTIKRKIICVGDYVAFYRKLVITLSSPPVHEKLKHQPICPSAGDQRPLFWWRGTTAEPYLSTILGWLREREMIDIYSNICWQGIVPECIQTNMLVEDNFLHQFIEDTISLQIPWLSLKQYVYGASIPAIEKRKIKEERWKNARCKGHFLEIILEISTDAPSPIPT